MSGFRDNAWHVRLPASARPGQVALAHVDAARLTAVAPETIARLWDPAACPANVLPYLAWALSVDVWDDRWPEEVKRDVVAAAPAVHRLKGTRTAVDRAMAALRITTSITEWWQADPIGRRGTFEITAFVRGKLPDEDVVLNARIQSQAIAWARAVKPKSRAFTFQLGAGFDDLVLAANRMAAMQVARPTVTARPDTDRANTVLAANRSAAMQTARRTLDARPDTTRRNCVFAASRTAAMQIMRATFVAA